MNATTLKYIETCANESENASVQKLSCADVRALLEERADLLASLEFIVNYWKETEDQYYATDIATDAINAIRKAKGTQ